MNRPPDHRYPQASTVFALLAFCAAGLIILVTVLNAYAESTP